MHQLLWKDSMSVGIPEMDADHQRIAALIGQLHDALAGHDRVRALELADELTMLARDHFAREDDMLRRHDYPYLSRHLHAHDDAMRRLRELRKVVAAAPSASAALDKLLSLGAFFLHRLFVMDMDYKWFFNDQRSRPVAVPAHAGA